MSQYQENFRMEGQKDGRTDPNSSNSSGHDQGSKKNSLIMSLFWYTRNKGILFLKQMEALSSVQH